LFGNELDATMNYQFTDAICWAVRRKGVQAFIQQVFNDVLNLYPKECIDVLMNPLSTHDIPRIQNILINALMLNFKYFDNGSQAFIWDYDKLECWKNDDGIYQTLEKRTWEHANCDVADEEKEQAKKLQKLAVAIQYSLPGVPSIFAGDELGVTGMKDPFNRSCMPWEKVDGNEMHEYYVKIGKVRNEYREIFSTAECKLLYLDEKICIYQRELGKKKLTCIFNLTGQSVIPTKKIIDGKIVFSIYGSSRIRLRPYDAIFVA
jgi:glycosidase